jgi:ferritin-like metal-binding protein YciE
MSKSVKSVEKPSIVEVKTVKGVKKVVKVVDKAVQTGKSRVKKSAIERLNSHAQKHIKSWHSKAGLDGPLFAKMVMKHARALAKVDQ